MKKLLITLEDLFNLPTSVIYNPDSYKSTSSVTIDSRTVSKGALFIAIKGEKFDGHDFVRGAIKKGASSVIVNENKYSDFRNLSLPVITVRDTTTALGDLAKVWRNKLSTKIIAITGSAGKTTTKEILSVLLKENYSVNKTVSNNNNHIGVPLTILSTNNKHDVLVLELGTNHFGEIAYSANIAQPDYALITNIGSSHLEFLKNKNGVLKEKIELFNSTVSCKGFLFINKDDVLLSKAFSDYPKKLSYGFNKNADVTGTINSYNDYGQPVIEIRYKNKTVKQTIPLYGEQSAKSFLSAATIALKLGINKSSIEKAALKLEAFNKRLNVKEYKDYLLIDDTYNANPESMKHALDLLGKIKKYDKKIAVLGDMFELGSDSKKLHERLASSIKRNKINTVYTTGKMMKQLDKVLKPTVKVHKHFNDRKKLFNALRKIELSNSVILVKGSRGMRMEEFVKAFKPEAND